MKQILEFTIRVSLLMFIWFIWWLTLKVSLSNVMNLSIIVGGVLLAFPVVWLGRKLLDKKPTINRTVCINTFVHYTLLILFGVAIIRAIDSHKDWAGWVLPIPSEIGLLLVIFTGSATLLTVINLALKGLGAPFAIAISRKLAVDWLYGWTRNPMVLAGLALYAVDSILMKRPRNWNYRHVYLSGEPPDACCVIEKKSDCKLCSQKTT